VGTIASLIVKIGAQDAELTKSLASIGERSKSVDADLKKLGNTPLAEAAKKSLDTLNATMKGITDATQRLADRSVAASQGLTVFGANLGAVGGVAKLTSRDLDAMARTVTQGLDAFRALGQQAPADLQKVADAIKAQQAALKAAPSGAAGSGLFDSAFAKLTAAFSASSLIDKTIGAVTDLGRQAFATAGALVDMSNKTGLSTDTLQRMDYVAKQSGSDVSAFAEAAFKMGVTIQEGSGKARQAAEDLGLSWQQLRSASPDDQYNMVVKALEAMENPQRRNTDAVGLFGKTAKDILAAIVDGYSKVAAGATVAGDAQLKAIDALGDAWDRWKSRQSTAFAQAMGSVILLHQAVNTLTQDERDYILQTQLSTKSIEEFDAALIKAAGHKQQFGNIGGLGGNDIALPNETAPPVPESFVAKLKAAEAGFRALTAAKKADLVAAFTIGASNDDIINQLGVTEGVLGVAKKAFEANKSAIEKAAEAEKKWVAAGAEIASVGSGQFQVLNRLGDEWADYLAGLVKAGATEANVALRFHLTDAEMRGVIERTKNLTTISGLNNQTQIATGEILSKLGKEATDTDAKLIGLALTLDHMAAIERGLPLTELGALPTGFKEDFQGKLTDAERAAKRVDAAFKGMTDTLRSLGEAAGGTFGIILSGLGSEIDLLHKAIEAAGVLKTKGAAATQDDIDLAKLTKNSAIYTGLAIGFGAAASAIPTGGRASRGQIIAHDAFYGASAGATAGAAIGAHSGNPWLVVGGAAAGAVVGLVRSGQEWRQISHDIARDFQNLQVSDDFAHLIADLEDTTGLRSAQVLTTQLDKLIEQAGGLRADNVDLFFRALHDGFSMVQRNELSTIQMTQVLDKNFGTFVEQGTNRLGLLSEALLEIIQLDARFNTQSGAIFDYKAAQITDVVLPNLTDLLTPAKKGGTGFVADSKASADALAGSLGAAFVEMMREGVPLLTIFQKLTPLVTTLEKQLKTLGLTGGAAFGQIAALSDLAKDRIAGPLLTAAQNFQGVLVGLENTHALTQDLFGSISLSVTEIFDKLVGKGKDAGQVMLLMRPALQTIFELQERGFKVDEKTQALLDRAEKQGVIGDQFKSVGERTIDRIEESNKYLAAIAGAFGYQLPPQVPKPGRGDPSPTRPGGPGDVQQPGGPLDRLDGGWTGGMITAFGIQHFKKGGRVLPFAHSSDTVHIMATPGEMLITEAQQRSIGDAMLAARATGGETHVHLHVGTKEVAHVVLDEIQAGGAVRSKFNAAVRKAS